MLHDAMQLNIEPMLAVSGSGPWRLLGVLAVAVILGVFACWSQRWLLASRMHVLNWLLVIGLGCALVTSILMVVAMNTNMRPLLGEELATPAAWIRLILCVLAMSVSMLSLLTMTLAMADRLVHRSALDAMAALKHIGKMAIPTATVAMCLGFVVPAIGGAGAAGPVGATIIGCMLWLALQIMFCLNAAAVCGALVLRRGDAAFSSDQKREHDGSWTIDDRKILWLAIASIVTLVMAMLGFFVLSMLMITMDTAGHGMMILLGFELYPEASLLLMAGRWVWLDVAVVLCMAAGAAAVMRMGPAFGPSLRSMLARQGKLSWFSKAPTPEAAFDPENWHKSFEAGVQDSPASGDSISTDARSASAATAAVAPSSVSTSLTPSAGPPTWSALAGVFPTRGHYVILAILAAVFVFYASLIPVEYKPLSWDTAVERFSHVKYYKLGIDRRADVLANLVVVVPVAYLLMAALTGLTWGWLRRSIVAIIVAVLTAAFVVAIEFTQEWFPPRTVSLNDIQAGLSGGAVGIILFLAVGDALTYIMKIAVSKRGSATALRQMLWLFLATCIVYGLFPMDFTLNLKLLTQKYDEGRLILLPLLQGNETLLQTLGIFLRDVVLFVPVGLLMWRPWSMKQPWSWAQSMLGVAAIAIILEMMRIPVFSSHTGTIHVLGRIAGGWMGLTMVPYVLDTHGQLALGTKWSETSKRTWGTAGGIVLALIAAAALLYPFKFDGGQALFEAKMQHFINWPFQLYYYAGEWSALNKVIQCMALFAATGVVMRWGWNTDRRRRVQGLMAMLVVVSVIGMGVELGHAASGQRRIHTMSLDKGISLGMQEQAVDVTDLTVSKGMVFSIGKVADITDWLAYLSGATAGWIFAGLTLPVSGAFRKEA